MSSDKFNPHMPGMPPMMPGMDPSMGGMPGMPGMPGMSGPGMPGGLPLNPMLGGMVAPINALDHNMMGMPPMPGEEARPDVDLGAERIIMPRGVRAMNTKKILICGLPESGKTEFADEFANELGRLGKKVAWFNGSDVRASFNDDDFTERGRVRQAWRMRAACDDALQMGADIAIADFIAPTEELRNAFSADIVIWMDTPNIPRKFEDTAVMWQDPVRVDMTITTRDPHHWAAMVIQKFNLLGGQEEQSSIIR